MLKSWWKRQTRSHPEALVLSTLEFSCLQVPVVQIFSLGQSGTKKSHLSPLPGRRLTNLMRLLFPDPLRGSFILRNCFGSCDLFKHRNLKKAKNVDSFPFFLWITALEGNHSWSRCRKKERKKRKKTAEKDYKMFISFFHEWTCGRGRTVKSGQESLVAGAIGSRVAAGKCWCYCLKKASYVCLKIDIQ